MDWAYWQLSQKKDLILWEDAPKQLKIELSWMDLPSDLDLEVALRDVNGNYYVNYKNMGSNIKYPYAKLDMDVRNGPGTETIVLSKVKYGCYDVYVHNYTREEMIRGKIQVTISAGIQRETITKEGFWKGNCIWHVGILNAIGIIILDEWISDNE
jgi:uncharacterized protein YfaP (DUF2135 family)